MNGRVLNDWSGVLDDEIKATEEKRGDLDQGDSDDDGNEGSRVFPRDKSFQSGSILSDATNEVPKELSVKNPPDRCPDNVNTGSHGDESSPLIPDKGAHS